MDGINPQIQLSVIKGSGAPEVLDSQPITEADLDLLKKHDLNGDNTLDQAELGEAFNDVFKLTPGLSRSERVEAIQNAKSALTMEAFGKARKGDTAFMTHHNTVDVLGNLAIASEKDVQGVGKNPAALTFEIRLPDRK